MSIKKLTVENAQIKTASVEVKTLTISGKQVTLAVFRQLPRKGVISLNDLKLNGNVWGHVNYHPDKCDDGSNHLHVVWQTGSSLFRDTVSKKMKCPFKSEIHDQALGWAISQLESLLMCTHCTALFDHLQFWKTMCPNGHELEEVERQRRLQSLNHWYYSYNSWCYGVTCQGEDITAEFRHPKLDGTQSRFYSLALEWWRDLGQPSESDADADLQYAILKNRNWTEKYKALYERLANQDQLFIAV